MTESSTIAQIAQDAALTDDEKAARISSAASGNSVMMGQYATLKRNYKVQLDTISGEFDKVANSGLLKNVANVMEVVEKKGDTVNTRHDSSARLSIKVLRERAAEQRGMLQSILQDNGQLAAMFNLMQKSEMKMIGLANGMREETRLALITLDRQRKQSPQILKRQDDEDAAIGMIEKALAEVDDRRRAEKARRDMSDFLSGGLATEKPVSAPARARFRRP
jgi:hypothetical protein